MAKILSCPHFISINGLTKGCMLGKFPVNCETCNCSDKRWVEYYSDTVATNKTT